MRMALRSQEKLCNITISFLGPVSQSFPPCVNNKHGGMLKFSKVDELAAIHVAAVNMSAYSA